MNIFIIEINKKKYVWHFLKYDRNNWISDGTETCFYGLEDAVTELEELENGNELDLPHNSLIYKIVENSSSSDSSLNCQSGTVPFLAYCGNYFS